MSIQNMPVSFSFNKGAVTLDSVNFLLCSPVLWCKSMFPFAPMTIWYRTLLSRELLVRRTETVSLASIISGNLVLCKRYRFDLLLLESFITSQIVSENIFEMMVNIVVSWSSRLNAEKWTMLTPIQRWKAKTSCIFPAINYQWVFPSLSHINSSLPSSSALAWKYPFFVSFCHLVDFSISVFSSWVRGFVNRSCVRSLVHLFQLLFDCSFCSFVRSFRSFLVRSVVRWFQLLFVRSFVRSWFVSLFVHSFMSLFMFR